MLTMKKIREWADELLPGSECKRAEIRIDALKKRFAVEDRYNIRYCFDSIGEHIVYMESCWMSQRDVKIICERLMKMEVE